MRKKLNEIAKIILIVGLFMKKSKVDIKNAHIIRDVSNILSVREEDALKTVEKFLAEIAEMKKELKGDEIRKIHGAVEKM